MTRLANQSLSAAKPGGNGTTYAPRVAFPPLDTKVMDIPYILLQSRSNFNPWGIREWHLVAYVCPSVCLFVCLCALS